MATPQPSPTKKRRKAPTTILVSVIVALIGAIATLGASLIQSRSGAPGSDPHSTAAKDVLAVDSINPVEYTLRPEQLTVPLNGKLPLVVPSGREVWAAVRKRVGADDTGSLQQPGLAFTPVCTVDERAKTFDCGEIQVGPDTPEAGSYYLYLGLADSSAEKQLVAIEVEQKGQAIWSHPAPNGLDVANTIRVTRPSKTP